MKTTIYHCVMIHLTCSKKTESIRLKHLAVLWHHPVGLCVRLYRLTSWLFLLFLQFLCFAVPKLVQSYTINVECLHSRGFNAKGCCRVFRNFHVRTFKNSTKNMSPVLRNRLFPIRITKELLTSSWGPRKPTIQQVVLTRCLKIVTLDCLGYLWVFCMVYVWFWKIFNEFHSDFIMFDSPYAAVGGWFYNLQSLFSRETWQADTKSLATGPRGVPKLTAG